MSADQGYFHHSISVDAPLIRGSSRLESYSDALFSIVATIMVLPIAHTVIPEEEALSSSLVRLILPKLIVYACTFLIICHLWTQHVALFDVIGKVDEFAVIMNLAMMMSITFFPFSFTLLGQYPLDGVAIQIFCGTLTALILLKILLIWYVFRQPAMIRDEIRETNEQDMEKRKLYFSSLSPLLLTLLALILSFFIVQLAIATILLLPFVEQIRAVCVQYYLKCRNADQSFEIFGRVTPWRKRLLTETVNKERIEFFSDGVFAIVATLIILDICEDNIPDSEAVHKAGGLAHALSEDKYVFLAYIGTFLTVGLQWYVHHSLLHYVKEVSKLMVGLNFLCLMFVGITPFAFKITSTFDKQIGSKNEQIAIQINSAIILLTGLSQSGLWITALFNQNTFLQDECHHNGKDHAYMASKLAVYPLISLVVFFASLIPVFKATIFIGVQISVLAVYILLGLLFTEMRKWSRPSNARLPSQDLDISVQI